MSTTPSAADFAGDRAAEHVRAAYRRHYDRGQHVEAQHAGNVAVASVMRAAVRVAARVYPHDGEGDAYIAAVTRALVAALDDLDGYAVTALAAARSDAEQALLQAAS